MKPIRLAILLLFSLPGCAACLRAQTRQVLPDEIVSVHQVELERHIRMEVQGVNTEVAWSFVSGFFKPPRLKSSLSWLPGIPDTPGAKDSKKLWWAGEVYGYHPFWMGSSWRTYDLSSINRIGYFAYAVNPNTGESRNNMATWGTTSLQEKAHEAKSKVDLVVALYGEKNLNTFLRDYGAQLQLIRNVLALLALDKRGDGVNLDFQGVTPANAEAFRKFAMKFSRELKAANVEYEFSITIPSRDPDQIFNFGKNNPFIDRFLVMAYDHHPLNGTRTGPSAVLAGKPGVWRDDIRADLQAYLNQGIPRNKMVLVLPWFGKKWEALGKNPKALTANPGEIHPFLYFQENYGKDSKYDATSNSVYSVTPSTDKNGDWTHCWWDNQRSLSQKFDFVKESNLKGVGIWCLGYDHSTGAEEGSIPLLEMAGIHPFFPVDSLKRVSSLSATDSIRDWEAVPKNRILDLGDLVPIAEDSLANLGEDASTFNPYMIAGKPLSYSGDISPSTQTYYYFVTVDSFSPVLPSTDEEILFLSPDIPLPFPPEPLHLGLWALIFLACFVAIGMCIPLFRFEIRMLVFVTVPWLGYLYVAIIATLVLLVFRGFGWPLPVVWSLLLLALSLVVTFFITRALKDVKQPVVNSGI